MYDLITIFLCVTVYYVCATFDPSFLSTDMAFTYSCGELEIFEYLGIKDFQHQ